MTAWRPDMPLSSTRKSLKPGQEVTVHYPGNKYRKTAPHEVVKVGVSLVHLRPKDSKHPDTTAFRLDTQRLNGTHSSGTYFTTHDQDDLRSRWADAWEVLLDHGLEASLRGGRGLTLEHVEAVAEALTAADARQLLHDAANA